MLFGCLETGRHVYPTLLLIIKNMDSIIFMVLASAQCLLLNMFCDRVVVVFLAPWSPEPPDLSDGIGAELLVPASLLCLLLSSCD